MREACPNENEDCRYFNGIGCFKDRHHKYYPANNYNTHTEKTFRNLPENIELMPRCLHDAIHADESAPIKPSLEVMRDAIRHSREGRGG